jgi:hypothetical protein
MFCCIEFQELITISKLADQMKDILTITTKSISQVVYELDPKEGLSETLLL